MLIRTYITICGAVQGVGFRPFVYRLAKNLELSGNVANTSAGVLIEIQGTKDIVEEFCRRVVSDAPEVSVIDEVKFQDLATVKDESSFTIIHSDSGGSKTVTILPDLATCNDCIDDISNSENRRYGYSFTNCTNCGPRFSIINDIPYDRPNTEMRKFKMCPNCQKEYDNPLDRRFHAQPNACSVCGPKILFIDTDNNPTPLNEKECLKLAQQSLTNGKILALKGIGGYQLLCAATQLDVVASLRKRKMREEKPFAVMVQNLETIKQICDVSEEEEKLLTSISAPIVLLQKNKSNKQKIAINVAPENPYLGVMLPYSPLHHLLLNNGPKVLVCTSGNLHDEPIAISNSEAQTRLNKIADVFLTNNRQIARQVDDSVVRQTEKGAQFLRRARGYAPFPIIHKKDYPNILSLGAHLKNTIAITTNNRTILSQHIGDLSNQEAYQSFLKIVEDLPRLYDFKPDIVACDLHPDYLSTQHALSLGIPVISVQHHHAHIASVMAEHNEDSSVFGIAWDGTGFGTDKTVWGGEFLVCEKGNFERWGNLMPFPLPGGDLAAKEPQRSAIGILYKLGLSANFNHLWNPNEVKLVEQSLEKNINTPMTSSIGRLFDAISSLLDIRQITAYEGHSAMMLEFCATNTDNSYSFDWLNNELDWRQMVLEILKDRDTGVSNGEISGKFHNTLVNIMVDSAKLSGLRKIALGGGVFQNRLLFEKGISALQKAGFEVLTPINVPANDGGIALGQAFVAGLVNQC
ncbi:MAG: carbamoyltransferase HypF [Candidatus Marinimicrobia bacterium]|nr:carbamoyltransferase HypF [Candidatus Neomarinimicrobiota bacterium]MBL7023131.1 carbamoyltransferase HypF [Candidatus Neomarinimicrobiota bacterium]MBL7109061.1 carbamoyltransferase HypF [Candidatus Neomarinimicrobiota bacterium]